MVHEEEGARARLQDQKGWDWRARQARQGRRAKLFGEVDQAALLGVALAAVIALVVAPGLWVSFSTVMGITLLGIIAAYYQPAWPEPGDSALKQVWTVLTAAVALGMVIGLCASLALGFPIQEVTVTYDDRNECWVDATAATRVTGPPFGQSPLPALSDPLPPNEDLPQAVPPDIKTSYENCVGGKAFDRLPWVWVICLTVVGVVYIGRWATRLILAQNLSSKRSFGVHGRVAVEGHNGGSSAPVAQAGADSGPESKRESVAKEQLNSTGDPSGGGIPPAVTDRVERPKQPHRCNEDSTARDRSPTSED